MGKAHKDYMTFQDEKGILCGVRQDNYSEQEAENIALKAMFAEKVERTREYSHMYFGYGFSDGETQSTWWLIDKPTKNSVPVYVFREVIDD